MFCPELQRLLKPIYDLTRKGRQFIWGEEQVNLQQAVYYIRFDHTCKLERKSTFRSPRNGYRTEEIIFDVDYWSAMLKCHAMCRR